MLAAHALDKARRSAVSMAAEEAAVAAQPFRPRLNPTSEALAAAARKKRDAAAGAADSRMPHDALFRDALARKVSREAALAADGVQQ